jgi:hypothetical protein
MVEEYFKNPLILGLITFILIYVILKYTNKNEGETNKNEEGTKKMLTKSIIGGILVGIIGYCIVNYSNAIPIPEMIGGGAKIGFDLSAEPKKVLLEELMMSSSSTVIQGGGILAKEISGSSLASEIINSSKIIEFNTKPMLGGTD